MNLSRNDGSALLIALMATLLMLALGTALMLATITETRIASSYGGGVEAFYAAEAAIERAMGDLQAIPDWTGLASSAATSAFVDGPPGGVRILADGMTLDLGSATGTVREGENPPWRLFAWGPLSGLLPADMTGGGQSRPYVVVWLTEAPPGPDAGALALLAHAYGARGVRRAIEVLVTRIDLNGFPEIRVLSWREVP